MGRKTDLHDRTLLAPARLVADYPILCGYEMGVAATAGAMEFDFDLTELDLDDDELQAAERAVDAVEQARNGFLWRRPWTEEDIIAMDIGEFPAPCTAAERLRDQHTRRRKIWAAVAAGDVALPALARHGLVLTVTTCEEEFAPVPASVAPLYPYAAIVDLRRVEAAAPKASEASQADAPVRSR